MDTLVNAYKRIADAALISHNSETEDRELAAGAVGGFWLTLKDSVIQPKIDELLTSIDQDVAKHLAGQLSKEDMADAILAARVAAGHLQDIIDKVERTHEFFVNEGKRNAGEDE